MTRVVLLTLLTALCMTACTNKTEAQSTKKQKVLVAYFSATGTTKVAAQKIAKQTGADLFAIEPTTPYTAADLDWTDKQSRSSLEMSDAAARPALRNTKSDIADYDIIYLGYPIWWNVAPRIINTFIEAHNLQGKTIIPFATSGSSQIEASVKALRQQYPKLTISDGALLNRATDTTISNWLGKEHD